MARRRSTMTVIILSMAVIVMMVLSTGQSGIAFPVDQPVEALFTDAARPERDLSDDPTIIHTRFVNVNFDLLGGTGSSPKTQSEMAKVLLLNLFEAVVFTGVLDRVESNPSGSFSWIGYLEGVEYSQVILVVKERVMAGNITLPGEFYQVRYVGNGVHAIHQIDQGAFPPEAEPIPGDIFQGELGEAAHTATADDGSIIDVMVVYTPAARTEAGGTTDMENLIDLAVAETNQSYDNSGITPRLNLVHTEEVSYTESGDMNDDLDRLINPSDGYMDNVHTLRDTYLADLVDLIVETADYCGLAHTMGTVSPSFESLAFSVVGRDCATGYYSFAHELGHNMGARHDWYVNEDVTPYTYCHGYVNVADQWRTIMAYNDKCDDSGSYCTRLQYWSNPDVPYGGDPMGISEGTSIACTTGNLSNPPCDADNRRTLNNTAYTVANFRSGPSPRIYLPLTLKNY